MRKSSYKKISEYCAAGLSVALCAVFFVVQCMSNFDAAYSTRLPSHFFSKQDDHALVGKSHSIPGTKINIRLSKRFQPKSILFTGRWSVGSTIACLEVVRSYYIYDSNPLSDVRLHESLRGPPALVC